MTGNSKIDKCLVSLKSLIQNQNKLNQKHTAPKQSGEKSERTATWTVISRKFQLHSKDTNRRLKNRNL